MYVRNLIRQSTYIKVNSIFIDHLLLFPQFFVFELTRRSQFLGTLPVSSVPDLAFLVIRTVDLLPFTLLSSAMVSIGNTFPRIFRKFHQKG